MKRTLISVLALTIVLTQACKKKKQEECPDPVEETPAPVVYPSYSQLKPGNYWIYGRFQVEQNGVSTDLQQYDSCYVEKDTMIRNQTYFKLCRFDFLYNKPVCSYLRDSLHYIINSQGKVVFSSEDFSTVFNTFYFTQKNMQEQLDTLFKVTSKMNDKDLEVTVPAGNFKTSSMQITYQATPIMLNPMINNPRFMNTRFAKNIGIITETEPFFAGVPYMTEKRLVRYHLD